MDTARIAIPHQLQSIIDDMKRAFDVRLYYPALTVALTLPQVCMGLTLPRNEDVRGGHYKAFIQDYADLSQLGVDPSLCYQLRCGVVHRGDATANAGFPNSHVVFSVPETGCMSHGFTVYDTMNSQNPSTKANMIDLQTFCQTMIGAVENWYSKNRFNPLVQANVQCLLSWRPNGVATIGMPVIASGP